MFKKKKYIFFNNYLKYIFSFNSQNKNIKFIFYNLFIFH